MIRSRFFQSLPRKSIIDQEAPSGRRKNEGVGRPRIKAGAQQANRGIHGSNHDKINVLAARFYRHPRKAYEYNRKTCAYTYIPWKTGILNGKYLMERFWKNSLERAGSLESVLISV